MAFSSSVIVNNLETPTKCQSRWCLGGLTALLPLTLFENSSRVRYVRIGNIKLLLKLKANLPSLVVN